MKIRYVITFLLSLAGALVIALGLSIFTATTASTTFYYSVTDLGTLGGTLSISAEAINDAGQVVGTSSIDHLLTPGNGPPHAFLWSNGTMRDIGTLGGRYSSAYGINRIGQVVGDSQVRINVGPAVNLFQHAFLWNDPNLGPNVPSGMINGIPVWNGPMRDMGTLGGNESHAYNINDSGQVVGSAQTSSGFTHAFLWSNGTMRDLGTLGGLFSTATSINNNGLIVGNADTSSSIRCPFLWYQGTMFDLGTPNGYTSSYAFDINDLGVVVGSADTSSGTRHPFLWYMGARINLGSLGGNYGDAFAINNHGLIVGSSKTSSGYFHAFILVNGRMLDLNNLLPANSGWELTSARDINNNGQIVGSGIRNAQTRAFLLTPTWVIN